MDKKLFILAGSLLLLLSAGYTITTHCEDDYNVKIFSEDYETIGGNIDMEYQGPVPEGYDLDHFRKTGETIKEVIN